MDEEQAMIVLQPGPKPWEHYGTLALRKLLSGLPLKSKRPIQVEIPDPQFTEVFDALNGEKGAHGIRMDQLGQFDDHLFTRVPQKWDHNYPYWYVRIVCLGPRKRRSDISWDLQ